MDNAIVGIRYIGKKDRQQDTVCKTGALWSRGQVHNFSTTLAKSLLVHTDSFEQAEISIEGGTYLSRGKESSKSGDVAAFVNLTAMSVEQMVHFARLEFNRVVATDGKDEAQVRREVHGLMTNHNLDVEAERRQTVSSDGRVAVSYRATPEEHAALMAGTVVLAIVPAEVATFQTAAQPPIDNAHVADGCEQFDEADTGDEPPPPELSVLLASLDKADLIAFARQENVPYSNSMSAEKLREKIFAVLTERG